MRFIAALLAFSSLLLAQTPAAPAPKKIQALIITGQNGHDWRTVCPLLRKALEDTGLFTVDVATVILNYADWRKTGLRWGDRAESALLDFVRSGHGLVVYHFSAAAFDGWTEFEKLSGANWRPNNGQHSAAHDFTVQVVDPDHPITRGLPRTFVQRRLLPHPGHGLG